MDRLSFKPHEKLDSDKELYNEYVEKMASVEEFYKIEGRFLEYLFDFEKEKAMREANFLVSKIQMYEEKGYYPSVKYYLISLVGMIAKRMRKIRIVDEKIFTFSSTATAIIDEKYKDNDAIDLISEIVMLFIYKVKKREHPNLLHQTVNEIVNYIDDNIREPLSVEGIAKKFNISTSHLSRIFREFSGVTLVEYINIKKVEESQYYLRFSNHRISEISDNFNFCNQSYFTRIFKKYTGLTPRNFKKDITGEYFLYSLHPEKEFSYGK